MEAVGDQNALGGEVVDGGEPEAEERGVDAAALLQRPEHPSLDLCRAMHLITQDAVADPPSHPDIVDMQAALEKP